MKNIYIFIISLTFFLSYFSTSEENLAGLEGQNSEEQTQMQMQDFLFMLGEVRRDPNKNNFTWLKDIEKDLQTYIFLLKEYQNQEVTDFDKEFLYIAFKLYSSFNSKADIHYKNIALNFLKEAKEKDKYLFYSLHKSLKFAPFLEIIELFLKQGEKEQDRSVLTYNGSIKGINPLVTLIEYHFTNDINSSIFEVFPKKTFEELSSIIQKLIEADMQIARQREKEILAYTGEKIVSFLQSREILITKDMKTTIHDILKKSEALKIPSTIEDIFNVFVSRQLPITEDMKKTINGILKKSEAIKVPSIIEDVFNFLVSRQLPITEDMKKTINSILKQNNIPSAYFLKNKKFNAFLRNFLYIFSYLGLDQPISEYYLNSYLYRTIRHWYIAKDLLEKRHPKNNLIQKIEAKIIEIKENKTVRESLEIYLEYAQEKQQQIKETVEEFNKRRKRLCKELF